jgi:hypothetical protein
MQYKFGLLFSSCKNLFYTFTKLSMLHMDVLKEMIILLYLLIKVMHTEQFEKKKEFTFT